MKLLDRIVNPFFETLCLVLVVAVGIFVDWRTALELGLAMLFAGTVLKIARTDRGVTELWDAMPDHQAEYFYPGTGVFGNRCGMNKLTIKSLNGKPFTVLIGVKFEVPALGIKFHTFGRVTSNAQGVAITRTWLGRGPATFMYLCSIPANQIVVGYERKDQNLPEDVTNWPHLFQIFF